MGDSLRGEAPGEKVTRFMTWLAELLTDCLIKQLQKEEGEAWEGEDETRFCHAMVPRQHDNKRCGAASVEYATHVMRKPWEFREARRMNTETGWLQFLGRKNLKDWNGGRDVRRNLEKMARKAAERKIWHANSPSWNSAFPLEAQYKGQPDVLTTAAEVAIKIQQEEATRMPRQRRGKDTHALMTLYDAEHAENPEYSIDTRVDDSMRTAMEVAAWREMEEMNNGLDTRANTGYNELLKFARQNPQHENHKEQEKAQEERHRNHQALQKARHELEEAIGQSGKQDQESAKEDEDSETETESDDEIVEQMRERALLSSKKNMAEYDSEEESDSREEEGKRKGAHRRGIP